VAILIVFSLITMSNAYESLVLKCAPVVRLSYIFCFPVHRAGCGGVLLKSKGAKERKKRFLTSAPVDVEIALSENGLDLLFSEDLLKIPRDDVVLFGGG
jgi:hypothetical protein